MIPVTAYDPLQGENTGFDFPFFMNLPIALLLITEKNSIANCNEAALQLLNCRRDFLVGKKLDQVAAALTGNNVIAEAVLKAVRTQVRLEAEWRMSGHQATALWLKVQLLKINSGWTCLLSDISLQKSAEERAGQLAETLAACKMEKAAAAEELEKIVFAASHDLQEPLRRISSFVQLLEKKSGNHQDEQSRKYINYIVDGSARMKKLILDLLEYAKVNGSRDSFRLTSLQTIAAAVQQNYSRQLQDAGATLVTETLPVVFCDSYLLTQLLEQLVSNALKYRSDLPLQIRISCREEEQHFYITVTDNGIGIHPDHREKIFDLFQRLHAKEGNNGTGLGLAICKKIVRIHQGRIGVDAVPDGGSCFWFTIPKSKNTSHEKL